MPESPPQRAKFWLGRLALLCLVPLIGLGTGCYLLWLEYHSQYAARYIGAYLMQQNEQRQPRGSLWQGILAHRRARLALADSLAEFDLLTAPQSTPLAVLNNRYHLQFHGPYAAYLKVVPRPRRLIPEQMTPETLRELALSLQVYEQGRALLQKAIIPADQLRIHAFIIAQIALENGSLFPLLHQRLLAQHDPEAWTFLRMEPREMTYWQDQLEPLLQTDVDSTSNELSPSVRHVLYDLIDSWQDSLQHNEIDHLLKSWSDVHGFEFRLTRNGDQFAAYALFPDESPTPFSLPAPTVGKYLGLDTPPPQ